ncbi:MAG TPA: Lrp/AsnC family transcriptional regulator [Polyangiaceae bacterium]|nr:Lrp/AsnC family transcriptional regulator [Polyangiaceae bacterium]
MPAELDDLDRRILRALDANARATHASIARAVKLSRSAVQERIARMEREGVIAGYGVRLGAAGAAPGLRAYLLVAGQTGRLEHVATALRGRPEVAACAFVSGEIDVVLEIAADSTEGLTRLRDEIAAMPGVATTRTLVVLASRWAR